jgi:hypothetical protein
LNCAVANYDPTDYQLCTLCDTGYQWTSGGGLAGADCETCATQVTDCTTCDHAGVCSACTGTLFPQIGGASCIQPQDDCALNNTLDLTICDNCTAGFWFDTTVAPGDCLACSTIDADCATCDSGNVPICLTCTAPKVLKTGSVTECITLPNDCNDDPGNNLDPTDNTICIKCNTGFYPNATGNNCLPCSTMASCTACDNTM